MPVSCQQFSISSFQAFTDHVLYLIPVRVTDDSNELVGYGGNDEEEEEEWEARG